MPLWNRAAVVVAACFPRRLWARAGEGERERKEKEVSPLTHYKRTLVRAAAPLPPSLFPCCCCYWCCFCCCCCCCYGCCRWLLVQSALPSSSAQHCKIDNRAVADRIARCESEDACISIPFFWRRYFAISSILFGVDSLSFSLARCP